MRHTVATTLREAGLDERRIADLLGQKTPFMARHYSRSANLADKTRTEQIRRWLTISPWVISGIVVTGIASMMAASWFWTSMLTRSEIAELGLTRIDQEEQTWLTLDPARTELKTCTLAGTPVICIKIEEK